MKLIVEITQPYTDKREYETRREWQGTEESPLMQRIAQALEVALWETLNKFSKTVGEGEGFSEDEARTKFNIDRDIRAAGGDDEVS